MRALILGGAGMLGRALVAEARSRGEAALALSREQADVTDPERLRFWVESFRPDTVINCAAFTQVDACEGEGRERAFAVNGDRGGARGRSGRPRRGAAGPRLDRLRFRRCCGRGAGAVPRGRAHGPRSRSTARASSPASAKPCALRALPGGADELALRARRPQLRGHDGPADRRGPAAAARGARPGGVPHLHAVPGPGDPRPGGSGCDRRRALPQPGARLLVRFRGRDRPALVGQAQGRRGGAGHDRRIPPSRAAAGLVRAGRRAASKRPPAALSSRGAGDWPSIWPP